MKCSKCGFENKDKAKFCTKCGNSLTVTNTQNIPVKSNNNKYIIIALIAIIVIMVGAIGYFAMNNTNVMGSNDVSQQNSTSKDVQSADNSNEDSNDDDSDSEKTSSISSTKSKSKEWVSIGSCSGSGSGSKTISVPKGKIMVKLSAYPIKNYATNHLYVSSSNGASGGVDWGSKSAVETRYDSFTYTSSSEEVISIDYYETVSWNVEFYKYQ